MILTNFGLKMTLHTPNTQSVITRSNQVNCDIRSKYEAKAIPPPVCMYRGFIKSPMVNVENCCNYTQTNFLVFHGILSTMSVKTGYLIIHVKLNSISVTNTAAYI